MELSQVATYPFVVVFGDASALFGASVVMIGFKSWPFLRFFWALLLFPLLPLDVGRLEDGLFAVEVVVDEEEPVAPAAYCLALLMAAFLMSVPFIVGDVWVEVTEL